ncbi:phosphate ABC transporter permease PstA [Pelobacter propionicus]|uniref:Phosphate transport system permease protein PstA n=1 Tax=Pelobacter propionicus (strain DSM 2379 / NBRC 103807 / OttBd1) TaxID=338966 RepID=A1ATT2_PELPD|nr:phosphate ABC transporter permease PstA [Pelobacter propionicus]ABL00753.1 phosphate ABC transporter membrane protein 2, PhoT family [Pelobacter propionicus DSM 2379]
MKTYLKTGEPFVLLTGAALALVLLMTMTLIGVVMTNGLGYFWPRELVRYELKDGSVALGQLVASEKNPDTGGHRLQLKVSNRDVFGQDFRWIDEQEISSRSIPKNAVLIERKEHGNYVGFLKNVQAEGLVSETTGDPWELLTRARSALQPRVEAIAELKEKMSDLNHEAEQLRLKILKLEYNGRQQNAASIGELTATRENILTRFDALNEQMSARQTELAAFKAELVDAGGGLKEVELTEIVRVQRPNSMSLAAKIAAYAERIRELLLDDPRESNTEGGLFPAIFGTVMMVLLMSVFSLPFGVIAAVYLREYAKDGLLTRMVRIAVNNLAGVPSIVYGVFGLGFFVYGIGGSLDQLFFPERLPTPTFGTGGILWSSLTLALLTVPVVIIATEESLASIPRGIREGSLALGATKFQTLTRILLPMATPGIMTGLILSMARAAGEVAPLMIVGVVKLAPTLPFDGYFPFFHMDRKFMHLGFHIYDVGFQSPNVEAAKPMVYVTTMLLIAIVIVASSLAIRFRTRMRKRYVTSNF